MDRFDLMAKDYDTTRRIERAKAIADEIRGHIIDGHKKTALEFGCGTGLVGFQLLDDFKNMVFVDSSAGMIEQVEQKIKDSMKPQASTLCCDFTTKAPDDLHMDYIFSSLVLHHIKDTELILSRLYNMLHNGGHLLIVDLDKEDGWFHAEYPDFDGYNGFEQGSLIETAQKVGFSDVQAKTFYHGSKTRDNKTCPYSLFILDAEKHGG